MDDLVRVVVTATADIDIIRAEQLGSGQFFSRCCHYIDLLIWFLGRRITGIHMGTRIGTPWMEKEGIR